MTTSPAQAWAEEEFGARGQELELAKEMHQKAVALFRDFQAVQSKIMDVGDLDGVGEDDPLPDEMEEDLKAVEEKAAARKAKQARIDEFRALSKEKYALVDSLEIDGMDWSEEEKEACQAKIDALTKKLGEFAEYESWAIGKTGFPI